MLRYTPYCCPKCDLPFHSLCGLRKHIGADHISSSSSTHSALNSTVVQQPYPGPRDVQLNHQGARRQWLTGRLSEKLVEDSEMNKVISQMRNQISNINRLNERTFERHEVERESLHRNIKSMTNELLAAEQLIKLLTTEKHKLIANCRHLKHRCDVQKDASNTLQRQLDEKTTIVSQKDMELARLNDFIRSTTEKQITTMKMVEELVPKLSQKSENHMNSSVEPHVASHEPSAANGTSHSRDSSLVNRQHKSLDKSLNIHDAPQNDPHSYRQSSVSSSLSSAVESVLPIEDEWHTASLKIDEKPQQNSIHRDWIVTSGGQYTINDEYTQHGESMTSSNMGLRRVNPARNNQSTDQISSHQPRHHRSSAVHWSPASARDFHDDQWPTQWTQ